ncbi:MAG: type III-B CRISPR-associated protein Cas10/Cmr2 [Anaerolineales bacterium]|nr:type III-B CRISPR-associated protein Cas10/Cmr2 [Anaerolineales bacterium]
MTKYLLQIHIGPVQGFIASARRCRDLWFGSSLLSELGKAVARSIVADEGEDALIFPAATQDQLKPTSDYAVSNKVVAIISKQNPKTVADKAEDALREYLSLARDTIFDAALQRRLQTWDDAKKQIDDLPEYYWVSVTMNGRTYKEARSLADSLLAARKNTRNFQPVTWGSNRPKSSLDGVRESVIDAADTKQADTMYKLFGAKAGEQLSGVDLLKRLGTVQKEIRVPSTSHMAAMPLSSQLKAKWNADLWQNYLDTLPNEVKKQEIVLHDLELPNMGDTDGSLLYESRLLDYFDRSENANKKKLEEAQKALHTFFHKTKIDRPGSYYALMMGDGDFMGEVINAQQDAATHRNFSRILSSFALEASEIVAKHHGAVIYAGGDDVMALFPLHSAVQCAKKVAERFSVLMSNFKNDHGRSPTFSAGIAIVHHLEPLEDALKLARDAEKQAKSIPAKNALAVVVDKRSGASRIVVDKWSLVDRLLNFAAMHQREMIPDRLAYQLRQTYLVLGGNHALAKKEGETEEEKRARQKLRDVVGLEASRIIGRKREADGKEKLDDKVKAYIKTAVSPPLAAAQEPETDETAISSPLPLTPDNEKEQELHIEAIATELIIAAEISQSCTLAGVTLTLNLEDEADAAKEDAS